MSAKAYTTTTSSCLETLPSLAETIALYIIDGYQPVSGYQIRKRFTEITNKRLSFGTLVPMLHRFEKAGLVVRSRSSDDEVAISYNWYLTPYGSQQLKSRLALLARMLKVSASEHFRSELDDVENEAKQKVVNVPEYHW